MDKSKLKTLLISPDTTIKQAMQKLTETAEKILFTVDANHKLLGTVTDGDIRTGLINGMDFHENVAKIMHRDFNSVNHNQPSMRGTAENLMIRNKIEQIPVMDDNGTIIDVLLWRDFLAKDRPPESRRMVSNQVVIMAGGKGTRLDPFTKILPKPLIPIGNKPVIEIIMEKFSQYGFHNFIYTLNYKKEYLKLFLKENNFPYSIDWVEEEAFLGTAGGLSLLKNRLSDTFFVSNCDSILDVAFDKVLEWHKKHKAAITIIGCHNEIKIPYGVLELSDGKLHAISEKPTHDVIINTGIYVMEPSVMSHIPENTFVDMNTLIDMVAKTEKISVYTIYGGWFDIGQWEEYKKTVGKIGGEDNVR